MSELMVIAEAITAVLIGVSLFIAVLFLKTKKQEGKVSNYRRLFLFGLIFFFFGLVLMAVYVFVDIPFWIGLPVAVLGLLYQLIGLWSQWKSIDK